MKIPEFMKKYSLYGSIITAWNWAESHRLVLEIDLSNLNQEYYSDEMDDFSRIILILDKCTVVDELHEGFEGFSTGDARIVEASEIMESNSLSARGGIKLVMMYDKYDGEDERLVSVLIYADDLSMIDSKM